VAGALTREAGQRRETDVVLEPSAGPGREPSGESLALSSDVVVLVARRGEPLRRVAGRLAELRSLGIEVERTLLVSGRRLAGPAETGREREEAPLLR
jgi:hypothetical protein